MNSRMVLMLMVVCWRYKMPFNEFESGVNYSIFSGNEQQKV